MITVITVITAMAFTDPTHNQPLTRLFEGASQDEEILWPTFIRLEAGFDNFLSANRGRQ